MIHADLDVARLFEHLAAQLVERALLVADGQVVFGEVALARLEPGHVRVGVEGYAFGPVAADDLDRARDALARLERQAVDEVVVDAREAGGARLLGDGAHLLLGLHAVDGVLHDGVEVLYAEAQTFEAEEREDAQVLDGRHARVALD